ncbi:MAG: LPS export ABC transporter periplasmic protein LptC [Chitinophagaceae bacterium]|nr:MAG: LPS export ABC transporter periplasmic protein LptC [Chitinophagaceae bacterium]
MKRSDLIKTFHLHIAALLLGCFFVMGCENDIREVNNLTQKKSMGVEEAIKIESYMSEGGKTKARLLAPKMLRFMPTGSSADTSYMEFPKSLHVDFFNDSTKVESTLDALYAKYFDAQKKIFLRDSVMVINLQSGDTLKSRELWWDQSKEEFYTDKPAEVHQRNGNVLYHSRGLRAAQDLSWRETYGNSGKVTASEQGLQ